MSSKNIYLFIIILAVLLLSAIGAAVFFGSKKSTGPEQSSLTDDQKSQTQLTAVSAAKQISLEPVLAPTIDQDKIKYYSGVNGNVYQSDFDGGNLVRVSDTAILALIKIIWSPDKTKVISVREQNNRPKKYFYDYATKKSVLLNENINEIAWSPDSRKIVYQFSQPQKEETNISIANPDGSNWGNILNTRIKNLLIQWLAPDKISLQTRPSGFSQGVVFLLDPDSRGLTKILDEIYGLVVSWPPQANKMLYSSTNERGNQLQVYLLDLTSGEKKDLTLSTFIEKCAWSSDNKNIFCAIPQPQAGYNNLPCPADKTLPDDWYKGTFSTNDAFYKIDTSTNEKTILFTAGEDGFDVKELLLSDQENYLFFINKKDSLLYSLRLK